MPNGIELLSALLLPVVVFTALRINAALVFLSLCLGQVLVQTVGVEATAFISLFTPQAGDVSKTTASLIMLFVPVVLTSIFMVFSIKGKVRTALNAIPAAGVGALGVLLAVPLLPSNLKYAIQSEGLWTQLSRAQALIIIISAAASLMFLWSQRRSAQREHEGKRSRKD